jgi:hypothetical protein
MTQPDRSTGVSPVVFWIGGAASVAALGVATWFSIDTQTARSDYDRSPTREKLEDGRAKMVRTNIAWGAFGGLTLLTAATGIFLVDWRGRARVTARIGAGSLTLDGRF